MFKHRKNEEIIETHHEPDNVIDINESKSEIGDVDDDCENDPDGVHGNNSMNKTFQNPSQSENNTCEKLFECEKCDVKVATKSELVNHKEKSHNWCSKCFSSYNSKDKLMDHILTHHKTNRK